MVIAGRERRRPEELAAVLIQERAVLLEQQTQLEVLRTRVAGYERHFGIASSQLHDAIDRGELTETAEVCDWIIDVEQLQRSDPT